MDIAEGLMKRVVVCGGRVDFQRVGAGASENV
jgi:hypothetical protein